MQNAGAVLPDAEICIDGKPVKKQEKKILLLFHKPKGIVCSTRQQRNEMTVTEYLDYPVRVYPIGRLDKDSEGLLLVTNNEKVREKFGSLCPLQYVEGGHVDVGISGNRE